MATKGNLTLVTSFAIGFIFGATYHGNATTSSAQTASTQPDQGLIARVVALEKVEAPIGTVVAFAGPAQLMIQNGWMVCDGAPLSKAEYPALFLAIGTQHGDGCDEHNSHVDGKDFNLPDYRGMFLRGVSGSSGRDPDVNDRAPARHGGVGANGVGSIQGDEIKSHSHDVLDPGHHHPAVGNRMFAIWDPANRNNGAADSSVRGFQFNGIGLPLSSNTENAKTGISIVERGGHESRPKNASVQFLIKVSKS